MYTEKELLQLAGKLAMTCHRVLKSDAKTVSEAIRVMEVTLDEYDNAIMSNVK
jgi:predicted phage tail protein